MRRWYELASSNVDDSKINDVCKDEMKSATTVQCVRTQVVIALAACDNSVDNEDDRQ